MKFPISNTGLSITQVMIAIFIILVGLSGISIIISRIIPMPGLSSLYFEASYLAQEGIELIRNIRDENLINSLSWNNGITSSTQSIPPFFTRQIIINNVDENTILITATITFPFRGKIYEFSAQEYLYQWIRNIYING